MLYPIILAKDLILLAGENSSKKKLVKYNKYHGLDYIVRIVIHRIYKISYVSMFVYIIVFGQTMLQEMKVKTCTDFVLCTVSGYVYYINTILTEGDGASKAHRINVPLTFSYVKWQPHVFMRL